MLAARIKRLRERLKSARQKSIIDSVRKGPVSSFKRRMQKEKDDLAKEGKGMQSIAFFLTLVSMILIYSFIPLFPQPLPVLVAVLVAFIVYVSPAAGLAIGTIPIVLGILYHISLVDFIGMLGSMQVRALFICLLVFFFVTLPIRFRRYEDAVGINLGIIAASMLFFNATYFLAIPLLLTVAVLFKKTQAGLGFAYYILISVPLMLLQYFQHILTITRVDYWNDPSAIPPIYTSLSPVFNQLQSGMLQFRLFDFSQTIGKVLWNVVEPQPTPVHTVGQAITQYLDSFPGIVLFVGFVAGIVWAVSLILPSLTRSQVRRAETIFPVMTAAGVTALFFLLIVGLQGTLAFSVKLTTFQMTMGILATMLFAIPATILNFMPKRKAEIEKNSQIILAKSKDLLSKIQPFEELLVKVKNNTPVDVTSPETKLTVIKEKLSDILLKAEGRKYKLSETQEKIKELDLDLAGRINELMPELNTILEHYQLTLNYSYVAWMKKLQEIGYAPKNQIQVKFEKDQSPETRIEYISNVLSASRTTANEVCQLAERIYSVMKSIYDPSLPDESRTISYSKQKLAEKTAPWVACEALVVAFKGWTRQYSQEISQSKNNVLDSLGVIAALQVNSTALKSVLGEKYPLMDEEIAQAAKTKTALESKSISILNVLFLEESLQNAREIAEKVLSLLYNELKMKEASIESLLPIEDSFWEKNATLMEQTAESIDKISATHTSSLHQIMHNLPSALEFVEPCLWTLTQYSTKNELLLNYPIAKTAIENTLKKRKRVSVEDLPFRAQDAEEYLNLFFNERNREFTFDEENLLLSKRT